jgi:hypothetical protein
LLEDRETKNACVEAEQRGALRIHDDSLTSVHLRIERDEKVGEGEEGEE